MNGDNDIGTRSSDREAALKNAVERGDIESVKLLLRNGVDVNIKYEQGRTPLMAAAERGNLEMVKLLVGNRANIKASVPFQTGQE